MNVPDHIFIDVDNRRPTRAKLHGYDPLPPRYGERRCFILRDSGLLEETTSPIGMEVTLLSTKRPAVVDAELNRPVPIKQVTYTLRYVTTAVALTRRARRACARWFGRYRGRRVPKVVHFLVYVWVEKGCGMLRSEREELERMSGIAEAVWRLERMTVQASQVDRATTWFP